MVSSLNGASASQTALVNPFQQRQDQQNRVQDDSNRSGQSKKPENTFQLPATGQKPSKASTALAHSDSGQNNQRQQNAGRGTLVDITV